MQQWPFRLVHRAAIIVTMITSLLHGFIRTTLAFCPVAPRPLSLFRHDVPSPNPGRLAIVRQSQSLGATPAPPLLTFESVFSFDRNDTVNKFDRLDDAIMGGVSTSTLMNVPDEPFAKWFGMCRTTGGGFCGIRTLPFAEPLNITDNKAQGFYLTCRLQSDNEPERRSWKMSTRTKPDRGEQLYQAKFTLGPTKDTTANEWSTVTVPFDQFRLVRGPRAVPNSPPLNVSGGIYQIGLTMSKFGIGENITEVENFRDGPFELQIKDIGIYSSSSSPASTSSVVAENVALPKIITKEEAQKQRSLLLKLLLPIGKLFFSEQSQRRKVAMTFLTTKRNMSRIQAILFGLRSRAASVGWMRSLARTACILCTDSLRSVLFWAIRLIVVYPIKLLFFVVKTAKKIAKTTPKSAPAEP